MHLFGGMIGWLLAAAVVLIPTFFVGRYAQTRPPLLTSSRAKSGFGGVLWLFLAGQMRLAFDARLADRLYDE